MATIPPLLPLSTLNKVESFIATSESRKLFINCNSVRSKTFGSALETNI